MIKAPVQISSEIKEGSQKFLLSVTYQACTDTFCLFPKATDVEVHFKAVNTSTQEQSTGFFQKSFKDVYAQGLVWTFLFVFVFGFLTSFTPCVYPMIPITLAILGREAHARSRMQTFLVSLTYVAGIAFTFSALGIFAASTGMLFGSFMSSPWVLGFIAIVFFVMALSMFGYFELEAPRFLRDGVLSHLKLHGYIGAFISGLLAGIVASPCVGPVLVGVLTFVAQTKDVWLGFWLLFTYAFGMGLIFLALGLSTSATKLLPKAGGWTNKIKVFFAVLLLGASLYYLDQLLLTSKLIKNSFFSVSTYTEAMKTRKGFALDLIDWRKYSDDVLAEAQKAGKPVIIDFRADWCAACIEMEEKTFTHQGIQLLSRQFVMIKFDATNGSPELEKLKERFKIVGLPTIVFISAKGQWLEPLTLTEFEAAGPFEERMRRVLSP